MSKKYILISLLSREKHIGELGKQILSFFYEDYPNLAPEYANFFEPVNKSVSSVEEALEYWGGYFGYFIRRRPLKSRWSICIGGDHVFCPNFKYSWNKNVDWFFIFQKLIRLSKAYFGYIHLFTDQEIEGAYLGSSASLFQNGPASFHLKKGIPQLGWGNYFGEEYVKEIDVDLLKSHGFEISPLGEGYVFNITPQISDVITDYETFDKRRTLLKSLFRLGLFQKYETVDRDSDNDLARYIQSLETKE